MWMQWLPWRFMVRYVARAKGFADPVSLLSKAQRFSQPSEIAAPIEILRLGFVLQARGLMNGQAIQHNLDWIWPFWAVRQFNPRDPAFIPRAFSLTQINLTHRNWTAVGIPGCAEYPLIDPRGLITPFYDSWSLDVWLLTDKHSDLIPSRAEGVRQETIFEPSLGVRTSAARDGLAISVTAWVEMLKDPEIPVLRVRAFASSEYKAWLAVSLRPCNPEGVSFVHDIETLPKDQGYGWQVNGKNKVYFDHAWDAHAFSQYHQGDVYGKLPGSDGLGSIHCPVGLATAAALFEVTPKHSRSITVRAPMKQTEKVMTFRDASSKTAALWSESTAGMAGLKVPDERFEFLYECAVRAMVLHTPGEVYPGPFTYKHFWFRDAVIICYALLCSGLADRVEKIIQDIFLKRQGITGYFHSQEGEWDSNGQVLWLLRKFCLLTGKAPRPEWKGHVQKAAQWILRKRIKDMPGNLNAGLFPAGFSAEHLGPNDFYYWDDFWGVEGLRSAAWFMEYFGEKQAADEYRETSEQFMGCIEKSLEESAARLGSRAMPAAPSRRLDTGAVGSIVVDYPLRLWSEKDPRVFESVEYLMRHCFVDGAFFHDIAHSGINPYLTLAIAQVLMRAEDPRFFEIIRTVAGLATRTGHWPEAIHPQTRGGCMGDGEHIWASAEWALMMRNIFVREEGEKLVLCSGIPESWIESGQPLFWGPAPTEFGPVSIELKHEAENILVSWKGEWRGEEPEIEVRLAGQRWSVPPGTHESGIEIAAGSLSL